MSEPRHRYPDTGYRLVQDLTNELERISRENPEPSTATLIKQARDWIHLVREDFSTDNLTLFVLDSMLNQPAPRGGPISASPNQARAAINAVANWLYKQMMEGQGGEWTLLSAVQRLWREARYS